MRHLVRPLLGLALAGLVAACAGGTGSSPASAGSPTPGSTPASAAISLEAAEFAFTPSQITVAPGDATISLANKGTIEHDFVVDTLGIMVHAAVGTTATGSVAAMTAGTYPFYCSIPGHKEAGMTGTLTVK